jgi:TonB family protein
MRLKDREVDLKLSYKKTLELALIISLVLVTGVFLASKEFKLAPRFADVEQVILKVEDIPVTQAKRRPPPPRLPSVVIGDIDVPIDADIPVPSTTEMIHFDAPSPPPEPLESQVVDFYKVEKVPEMIGGTQALMEYIRRHDLYPEIARTAESNGVVIVRFVVSTSGDVINAEVFQERPKGLGFGDAAVQAISAMKFTPGVQRDKLVPVRMQQEIQFRIK